MKTVFLTGITSQDSSYLAELLLARNYKIVGLMRRNSTNNLDRIKHLVSDISIEHGDMTDPLSLEKIIVKYQPDEIYNMAAMSHVQTSFENPLYTANTNSLGVLGLLEIIRLKNYKIKFYQASSSEIFGNSIDEDGFQRENTTKTPVSPYGLSKLFSYHATRMYRESYGLFACNGILFNHESPRRGELFVSQKIVKRAVEIKKGLEKILTLGNLDSYRDFGHAKDYVEAIYQIMNHTAADDFVVATGHTKSVREVCSYVFSKLGMDYKDFVKQDEKLVRPTDILKLKGDSSKARSILGWKPKFTFEDLLDDMIDNWERKLL